MKTNPNFRKSVLGGMACLIALIFTSCQQKEATVEPAEPVNPDVELIQSLGFDTSELIDEGDYYVVEGCIMLEKANLSDYVTLATRQWYTGSRVSQNNVRNITVRVSDYLSQDWHNAITDAVTEWNNLSNSDINLTVTTSAAANLSIQEIYAGSSYIAQATWPKNGAVGPIIRVNTYYNTISYAEKIHTIVHEIGHCLGLRHTNWQGYESQSIYDAESGQNINAVLIPGTPQTDPSSVMNRIVMPWQGFSFYDQIAIKYLYPISTVPPMQISFVPPAVIASEGGEGYYVYKFIITTPNIVINSVRYDFFTNSNPPEDVYVNHTWTERDYMGRTVECVEIFYSWRAFGLIELQPLFYVNGYPEPYGKDFWFDVFYYH